MKIFEIVKQSVTTRQAAKAYGLEVDVHGMALCPFHDDHHPSLKLDQRFYCFGCGASGDVIDFTAKLFGISPREAVQKLAEDFGINPRPPAQSDIPKHDAESTQDLERLCICVLREYLRHLCIWQLRYRPEKPEDPIHPRFAEAMKALPTVNFFLDALIVGDPAPRERVLEVLVKDGSIYELQAYVGKRKKEEPGHAGKYQPCA